MSAFEKVTLPSLESLTVEITGPATVVLKGTITCKDPAADLGPFVRAMHEAMIADRVAELRVDVSGLSFVNSSAIRLFIDWTSWIKAMPAKRYKLQFATTRRVTWQKTSFLALQSLAAEVISVEQVD
ncbi:MAG TPA: hypothetical protein VGM29_15515 [Polyangiaceae bacterium]|jgi:hypothetical protein